MHKADIHTLSPNQVQNMVSICEGKPWVWVAYHDNRLASMKQRIPWLFRNSRTCVQAGNDDTGAGNSDLIQSCLVASFGGIPGGQDTCWRERRCRSNCCDKQHLSEHVGTPNGAFSMTFKCRRKMGDSTTIFFCVLLIMMGASFEGKGCLSQRSWHRLRV